MQVYAEAVRTALMTVPERRVGATVNEMARAKKGDESGDSKSEKCTFSFLSF